jgi:hypothetical protein
MRGYGGESATAVRVHRLISQLAESEHVKMCSNQSPRGPGLVGGEPTTFSSTASGLISRRSASRQKVPRPYAGDR